jgi:hypothetical protein
MTRARDVADTQDNVGGAVAPFVAGKNKIINGDFTVNQRNFTSASNTAGFKFDRWDVSAFNSGTITDSSQTFTPGTAPVAGYEGSTYYRVVTDGSAGTGNYWFLRQKVESVRTFANQNTVISFWAKANSGTPKIAVEISQDFGSGGSPSSAVNTYIGQVTLSTSWTRYSITAAVPSISGKTIGTTANTSSLQLNLWITAGSNYDSRTGSLGIQANTFDIWGVQWEAGSVATPFTTATGTVQGELAACQRYYWRSTASGSLAQSFAVGSASSTTIGFIHVQNPVTMRTTPTVIEYSTLALNSAAFNAQVVTALTLDYPGAVSSLIKATVAANLTAGIGLVLYANSSTSAYLAIGAEL